MSREVVNEQSAFTITVTLPVTPNSVRYKLSDPRYERTVIDWTSATPGTSVEIEIPASALEIYNTKQRLEDRVVTVQADYGTDDQYTDEYTFTIKKMKGIRTT